MKVIDAFDAAFVDFLEAPPQKLALLPVDQVPR